MTAARSRARRRPWYPAAAVAALLAVTACSGPATPINASLKEYPQNVRLGDGIASASPIVPVPPSAPPVDGGGFTPLPNRPQRPDLPEPEVPSSTPPPVACPTAPAGAPVGVPAGPRVAAPPAAATYTYRTEGRHTVGGADTSTIDHPATSTRQVSAARREPGAVEGVEDYSYDVTVTLGANRTVTTYRVLDADVVADQPGGLYVTRVATLDPKGEVVSEFRPQPAMLVLPMPADEGSTFEVVSSDPRTGTTVAYSGRVGPHVPVDACGRLIDTRSVEHEGTISINACGPAPCPPGVTGAGPATTFTAEYDIATQYGGFAVRDEVHITGGGIDAPYTDDLTGTITTVPAEPAP